MAVQRELAARITAYVDAASWAKAFSDVQSLINKGFAGRAVETPLTPSPAKTRADAQEQAKILEESIREILPKIREAMSAATSIKEVNQLSKALSGLQKDAINLRAPELVRDIQAAKAEAVDFITVLRRVPRGAGAGAAGIVKLTPEQKQEFESTVRELMGRASEAFKTATRAADLTPYLQQLRSWREGVARVGIPELSRDLRVVLGVGEQVARQFKIIENAQTNTARSARQQVAAQQFEERSLTAIATARTKFAKITDPAQFERIALQMDLIASRARGIDMGGVEAQARGAAAEARKFAQGIEKVNRGLIATVGGVELNITRLLTWAMGWFLIYRAIGAVTLAMGALTIGSAKVFADFEMRILAIASEIVNLDPSIPFEKGRRTATGLANALVQLQPAFIGTQEQLQEILLSSIRYFGQVDLVSERGRTNFLTFANAIAFATQGINRAGQATQEIRSIAEGMIRPGAQLLQILTRLDPNLRSNLKLWRAQGTTIENLVNLMPGYKQAVGEVGLTLQGQLNRLGATFRLIQRQIGEGIGEIARPFLIATNAVLGFVAASQTLRSAAIGMKMITAAFGLGPEGIMGIGPRGLVRILERELAGARPEVNIKFKLEEADVVLKRYFETTVKGLQSRLVLGDIGAEELGRQLRYVADNMKILASASEENKTAWIEAEIAARTYAKELKKVREETEQFHRFTAPETRARMVLGGTQSIEEQRNALTTIKQLQDEELRVLELRRLGAFTQQGTVRDSKVLLEINKQILQLEEKRAGTLQSIADKTRELRQLVEQARTGVLRAQGMEFQARRADLDQQYRDEQEKAKGNAEILLAIYLKYAALRAQVDRDEVDARKQILVTAQAIILRAEGNEIAARLAEIAFQREQEFEKTKQFPEARAILVKRFAAEETAAIREATQALWERYRDAYEKATQESEKFRDAQIRHAEVIVDAVTKPLQIQTEGMRLPEIAGLRDVEQYYRNRERLEQMLSDARIQSLNEQIRLERELRREGRFVDRAGSFQRELDLLGKRRDILAQNITNERSLADEKIRARLKAISDELERQITFLKLREQLLQIKAEAGIGEPDMDAQMARIRAEQARLTALRETLQAGIDPGQARKLLIEYQSALQKLIQMYPNLAANPLWDPEMAVRIAKLKGTVEGLQQILDRPVQPTGVSEDALKPIKAVLEEMKKVSAELAKIQEGVAARAINEFNRIGAYLRDEWTPYVVSVFSQAGTAAGAAFRDAWIKAFGTIPTPQSPTDRLRERERGGAVLPGPTITATGGAPVTNVYLGSVNLNDVLTPQTKRDLIRELLGAAGLRHQAYLNATGAGVSA